MTSWNHSPSDDNPPGLTNLDDNGEYSDYGRTGPRIWPDWFIACGALAMFAGAGILAVILALVGILSKGG